MPRSHNPRVGGSNPPPATTLLSVTLEPSAARLSGALVFLAASWRLRPSGRRGVAAGQGSGQAHLELGLSTRVRLLRTSQADALGSGQGQPNGALGSCP